MLKQNKKITFIPCLRNINDIAFPIPLAPPVTIAILPLKSILNTGYDNKQTV